MSSIKRSGGQRAQAPGWWLASSLLLCALVLTGCEVDSASSAIEITPSSVALAAKGQSVTLTCVGGYECRWSLETEAWGMLNTHQGSQVIYTSLYQPSGDAPAVQTVTVASRFSSMSGLESAQIPGAATNAPSTNTLYATAKIIHLPLAATASESADAQSASP